MRRNEAKAKLCVALDFPTGALALNMATKLKDFVGVFKVGMELFTAEGPGIVSSLHDLGAKVFLDLKFYDIPNTVLGVSKVATQLKVEYFNVHCHGGKDMMLAATAATQSTPDKPKILGVTVLTSFDSKAYQEVVPTSSSTSDQVIRLAKLAQVCGLAGVVASPQEITLIRQVCGPTFLIVTPGIRPSGGDAGDQKRISTPTAAIREGADLLVVGRPITAAPNPEAAANSILTEIENAG